MASKAFIENITDLHLFIFKAKSQIPVSVYKELSEKWDKLRDSIVDFQECPVHALDLQHFPKPKKCAWFNCSCGIDPCKNIRPKEQYGPRHTPDL